jgi:chromosome segregation ATPase
MAFANMNAIFTVLRKVENTLNSYPTKCESLNTLSLKSKINYLNRDTAKLRKELTRATKRLNDKDSFISKLMREIGTLKGTNAKLALENLELRNKVNKSNENLKKSNEKFLEVKLTHLVNLKSKDENFNTYKIKMEERVSKCVAHYEEKLAQKDNYIDKLKSKRGVAAEDVVVAPPPTASDYESEEYELPAQKCAAYPEYGWVHCKKGECGHRRAPEKARRKSNRLKKKGGKGPNISFGDSYKNCNIANNTLVNVQVDNSKKKLNINPEFMRAYNEKLARFAAESRGEDPNQVIQQKTGSITWPMADVD